VPLPWRMIMSAAPACAQISVNAWPIPLCVMQLISVGYWNMPTAACGATTFPQSPEQEQRPL